MVAASLVSLHMARFDQLRMAGPAAPGDRPGLLFCEVGADCRAAGTDPASREAFTFLVVGLHDRKGSADRLVEDVTTVARGSRTRRSDGAASSRRSGRRVSPT